MRRAIVPGIVMWVLAAGVGAGAASAQAFQPKPSKIPDADIDAAIRKGVDWLKASVPDGGPTGWAPHSATSDELILYTFVHGGIPRDDPIFQAYLKKTIDKDPEKTYSVACAAMALVALDKVGYQWKLEQYARFFVDTQCQNGQWSYGSKVEFPKMLFTTSAPARPKTATGSAGAPSKSADPPVRLYGTRYPAGYRPSADAGKGTTAQPRKLVPLVKRRGPPTGDPSNSQYAALGIRACAEAGLALDPQCLQDALASWETKQNADGGWGYLDSGKDGSTSFGSMTVGGVGAVAIYDWLLRKPWKDNPKVVKGCQWIADTWDLTRNPKSVKFNVSFQYYYIYGIERVGMLVGTDTIG